jgi:hypothetical protein
MSTPRMAPANAFHAHPHAFEHTIFLNGLYAVFTARGRVPASIGKQGRYQSLVQFNEQDEGDLYEFFEVQG